MNVADPAIDILSLCSGAGGLDLGVSVAEPGARTRCYVEWEAYAAAVLLARMEDQALEPAPVWCGDIRDFDARCFRGHIGMVVSGDPCQPNSVAGNRKGADDERWLLDRVLEIFDESGAPAFFRENVAGNTDGQLGVLVPALEAMGCRVAAGIFSAAGVGASHRRERLFVLAHRNRGRRQTDRRDGEPSGRPTNDVEHCGAHVAHRPERGLGEFGGTQEPRCGGHADGGEPAMDNPASPRRGTGQPGEGGPLRDEARRAEPDGRCADMADAVRLSGGQRAGRERVLDGGAAVGDAENAQRRAESENEGRDGTGFAGTSGELADPGEPGPQGQPAAGRQRQDNGHAGRGGGTEVPLHTPGPSDPRWPGVLDADPLLAPALDSVWLWRVARRNLGLPPVEWQPVRHRGSAGGMARDLDKATAALVECEVRRISHVLAQRVDRLRLTGNGCHPLQVAHAYRTLSALLADAAAAEPVVRTE